MMQRVGQTPPRYYGRQQIAQPLKSGDRIFAAELPLMVTASDGVMASRLRASKVHSGNWAVYTYAVRYIRYSSLTNQTFTYVTAKSAMDGPGGAIRQSLSAQRCTPLP